MTEAARHRARSLGWRLLAGTAFMLAGVIIGATIANPHP